MTTTKIRHHIDVDSDALARAERLLLAYPNLEQAELEEAAEYLKRANPLETGILSGNKAAWAASERIRADHPHLFRLSGRTKLLWLVVVTALAAAIVALWDSGLTG